MISGWWAEELEKKKADGDDMEKVDFQFEWLRKLTQRRVIELAGLALASDFTPVSVPNYACPIWHAALTPLLH